MAKQKRGIVVKQLEYSNYYRSRNGSLSSGVPSFWTSRSRSETEKKYMQINIQLIVLSNEQTISADFIEISRDSIV